MLLGQRQEPEVSSRLAVGDLEALIREARRRQRRRWRARAAAAVVVLGCAAAVVALVAVPRQSGIASGAKVAAGAAGGSIVALKDPTSLAVSSAGVLYVVDTARDQILRRLPDGRFAVVAGSGREGFSGDGGPATKAELRLSEYSGVVAGADGTVYFADTGNNRVRAVLADGRIDTVVGDGRGTGIGASPSALTGSRPALRVELNSPTGLAFGPRGELYIAAQDIVALSRGTVSYFAGRTGSSIPTPADQLSDALSDGSGLAFDRAGDMFVADFPWLLERTSCGRVRFLGTGFRSMGGSGILASSPDHVVYEAYGQGAISRRVAAWPVSSASKLSGMSPRGVQSVIGPSVLIATLGTEHGMRTGFAPNGLAVGPDRTIYTDTNRSMWSTRSALVEIQPGGHVRRLWISH
jgi:hypothetical protein